MKTTIQWLRVTDELKCGRRVHQSSALLAVVMDRLIHMVRQEFDPIWKRALEKWRYALETRGLNIKRSKTEYMSENESETSVTVKIHQAE